MDYIWYLFCSRSCRTITTDRLIIQVASQFGVNVQPHPPAGGDTLSYGPAVSKVSRLMWVADFLCIDPRFGRYLSVYRRHQAIVGGEFYIRPIGKGRI